MLSSSWVDCVPQMEYSSTTEADGVMATVENPAIRMESFLFSAPLTCGIRTCMYVYTNIICGYMDLYAYVYIYMCQEPLRIM